MTTNVHPGQGDTPFELPALDLNFGNITDGTNIPPPILPVIPTDTANSKVPSQTDEQLGENDTMRRGLPQTTDIPQSISFPARQGSIRRFFSRTRLNADFNEADIDESSAVESRPQSRGGFSLMGDQKQKRPNRWFRRFSRSGDELTARRPSLFSGGPSPSHIESQISSPPPTIPELRDLEKENLSLGKDLFRHID